MAETKTLISAEQLMEMATDQRVELVRGELVQMAPVGFQHFRVVGVLVSWVFSFVTPQRLGVVGPELGFVLVRNPDTVRAPDVAFIRAERLAHVDPRGYYEGPPDLAVEVASPGDRAGEVQEKIRDYLRYGTRLVWFVDPESETVTAYRPSGEAHVYMGDQAVPGEDVLPGFSFRPADLFKTER